MDMQPVNSSQVESVGYQSGTLRLKFKNGGFYEYSGVPPEIYTSILKAESVGKFLSAHIKGKFHYKQVKP